MRNLRKNGNDKATNPAALGTEIELWSAAERRRGHMDAWQNRHIVPLASEWAASWPRTQTVSAVMPNLNTQVICGLRLEVSPTDTQRPIAETLAALGDKIELNRRMNETLEAMARAVFKSWFVDFDPVQAKSEGRQPQGIPAHIADLFPSTFQASPLGPIGRWARWQTSLPT